MDVRLSLFEDFLFLGLSFRGYFVSLIIAKRIFSQFSDVSSVNSMVLTFGGCSTWNSDISNWIVSRVTSFTGMFGKYLLK